MALRKSRVLAGEALALLPRLFLAKLGEDFFSLLFFYGR
jgi:hypothetical protein